MKIGPGRRRTAGPIDMVPMINFAFLLLIFVMLVGTIAAPDLLAVRPPSSGALAAQNGAADIVIVDAQGRIGFGGEILQPDALLQRAQAWQKAAGDRPLLVKADSAADVERVVTVLEVLRAAGVRRASLLTSKRSG